MARVVIVVTDGASSPAGEYPKEAAASLKADGVVVFAIGVKGYQRQELEDTATTPTGSYVTTIEDWASLADSVTSVSEQMCEVVNVWVPATTTTTAPPPPSSSSNLPFCEAPSDLDKAPCRLHKCSKPADVVVALHYPTAVRFPAGCPPGTGNTATCTGFTAQVRVTSHSIRPPWGSIRISPGSPHVRPITVRVRSQTESRKIPTRKVLPPIYRLFAAQEKATPGWSNMNANFNHLRSFASKLSETLDIGTCRPQSVAGLCVTGWLPACVLHVARGLLLAFCCWVLHCMVASGLGFTCGSQSVAGSPLQGSFRPGFCKHVPGGLLLGIALEGGFRPGFTCGSRSVAGSRCKVRRTRSRSSQPTVTTNRRTRPSRGTRREPFNSTSMAVNSTSFGSPHVRPMGVHRTCGELDEIKRKIPTRDM